MIEKVRVSLWDIFTFFMTGLLASAATTAFVVYVGPWTAGDLLSGLSKVPASITLVVAPLVFTLLGMLIEPLANYVDRYILKYVLGWATTPKARTREAEENLLKEEIRARYLGDLGGKIDNPYQLCKDYVEHKQLSTTFMVFLARYGFYRNCAFISVAAGVAAALISTTACGAISSLIISLVATVIFRRRAEEFYSYQAPAIYRAFLLDKVAWKIQEREGAT
ncbi:hypothetical protein [Aerolutibacter ruishenii]|uniref:Uncharacterized protein n=1 Tax=Aerolutibacter ruishenii TaxID=686800 RepID=A0A562M1N4_9GAMM|nr:hypothetical protein [Lysobacter ruishenii]TWI13521.1 hypothetical protein IP93_00683 [Lysobacter ruishenii]